MSTKKAKAVKLPPTLTINGKERPTTNSNGQPIAHTEEGVRNFYKWFGNSKVVDEKGRPLVVYHGTLFEFNKFDKSISINGLIYFSDNKDVALDYGNILIESYLKISSINSMDFEGAWWKNKYNEAKELEKSVNNGRYDGLLFENTKDPRFGEDDIDKYPVSNIYAVKSPTQIKSATGNDGSFDADDAGILSGLPPSLTINGKKRPTTNSKGQPIATTEQGIRNFYKWFGDSKVVDEQDRPLVVYHGGADKITEFDKSKRGRNTGAESAFNAFFFSSSQQIAHQYSKHALPSYLLDLRDEAEKAKKRKKRGDSLIVNKYYEEYSKYYRSKRLFIYEVYLKFENPLIHNFHGKNNRDIQYHELIQTAIQNNNDGVIFLDTYDSVVGSIISSDVYGAFSPTQIKSATGNDGSFNADDAGILSGLPANHLQFVEKVKAELSGENRHNKRTIEKMAGFYGISDQNLVKELTELAIVSIARSLALQPGKGIQQKFSEIVELYHNQVNLSHRTSRSILLQQYSTPAPLAYMMGVYVASGTGLSARLGSVKQGGRFTKNHFKPTPAANTAKPWPTPQKPPAFFEPSAGNGLLTIAIPPEYWDVNEIDETRRANLEQQGYNQVTAHNAADPLIFDVEPRKYDGVITNPPFGRLDEPVKTGGFLLDDLDHVMAAYALECMKNTGRAAIITGGHITFDEKTGRIKQQGDKGGNRNFYNFLYHNYNVEDILYINGDLYSRQGTSFDVRLILVNGRKETPAGFAPRQTPEMNAVINTWDEFYKAMERMIDIKRDIIMQDDIDLTVDNAEPWQKTRLQMIINELDNLSIFGGTYPKWITDNAEITVTDSRTGKQYNNYTIVKANPEGIKHYGSIAHRKIIQQAIEDGKPVPPEVLADYPELSNTQQSLELKYAKMIVAELISDDKEYRKKEGREPLTDDQYKEVHQIEVHERGFLKLKHEIDAKDYAQLSQKLYPHNRFWRKYFEEYTGVKLGKTLKETIQTLQQFTGFTPEPAPAKVKLSKEEALKRAKSARDEKVLSTRVSYSGVIRTRKENVDYVLSNGGYVEVAEVPSVQEPRNYNRLTWDQQREYERRRKIMKPEYRLFISPGTFYVISKAEYDYATEKENAKPESQPDTDLLAIEFEMAAAALELLQL